MLMKENHGTEKAKIVLVFHITGSVVDF